MATRGLGTDQGPDQLLRQAQEAAYAGPPEEVLTEELSTLYGHPVFVVAHARRTCPLVLPGQRERDGDG